MYFVINLHEIKPYNMKLLQKLFLLIFVPFIIKAQTSEKPFAIMLGGGLTQYNGDLGQGFFETKMVQVNGHGAGALAFYLNKSFDLNLQGSYGRFGYWENENRNFLTMMAEGSLNLKYKLNNGYLFKEDALIGPYIHAGIGGYNIKSEKRADDTDRGLSTKVGLEPYFSFGGGLSFRITKAVSIVLSENFGYIFKDNYDAENNINSTNGNEINDAFLRHTAGVNIAFGKGKPKAPKIVDTDLDGIPDNIDGCPNEKGPQATSGCPDGDGDGVVDKKDECVNVAGLVALNGCPDGDGDGVADKNDKCPSVAGAKSNNGCPLDSDGDGITDDKDQCPNEKGTVADGGCPEKDSDGDGVKDKFDQCPTVKGLAELAGCPDKDSDGDGIVDRSDKCPTVAGIKENAGCPEVKAEVKQVFKEALQGIQFETGSAIIKSTSNTILDKVVKVMNDNKEFNLLINGHTDNVGADALNLSLSQKRADAVKSYLVSKGINAAKMTATGYGETQPVSENTTANGRAQNRRVEFLVKF